MRYIVRVRETASTEWMLEGTHDDNTTAQKHARTLRAWWPEAIVEVLIVLDY